MERDFLGLNQKESVIVVKEETGEGFKDSGSGVPWSFPNKISSLPHFMSFKNAYEDKAAKIMSDHLASTGFTALSTIDAYALAQKHPFGDMQKNFNHDRQGAGNFPVTAFPVQHNTQPTHLPNDTKTFSVPNQTNSVSQSNPFFRNLFPCAGQNFGGATAKQQSLGGSPITPHPVPPSLGSVAGVTEPWFSSNASKAPPQLTIFYGGTVNVYEDISPEKAQAIMFLAGNGSTGASVAQPRAQVQTPASKMTTGDAVLLNQPMNTPPCSALSSPISVSSHPVGQSGSGSTSNNDEVTIIKSTPATPGNRGLDSTKMATSLGRVAASTMIPSAVPQARKASLARFLEKRKERSMSAAPYNAGKKFEDSTTS